MINKNANIAIRYFLNQNIPKNESQAHIPAKIKKLEIYGFQATINYLF